MCNHVIWVQLISRLFSLSKLVCHIVICKYAYLLHGCTQRDIFDAGISLCPELHSLINLRKPSRGFFSNTYVFCLGIPAASSIHLQVILLAMGCLTAICLLLPSSAQVRRTDKEQKLSVKSGHLNNFINALFVLRFPPISVIVFQHHTWEPCLWS